MLDTPGHYLNQTWLTIQYVLWHSIENNLARSVHKLQTQHMYEICVLVIFSHRSSRLADGIRNILRHRWNITKQNNDIPFQFDHQYLCIHRQSMPGYHYIVIYTKHNINHRNDFPRSNTYNQINEVKCISISIPGTDFCILVRWMW